MNIPRVRSLTLRESVDVAASPERVWAVFAELEQWASWNRVCVDARWVEGERWQPGAVFSMRLRMARRSVPFTVTVTEADVPGAVAWQSTVLTVTGHRRFAFEPLDGGNRTRVSDTKTFTSPILPVRLFYPRPIVQRMSRGWLASLKSRVEAQV